MAKIDKELQYRMDGMIYALKIAREQGIEALEKDIKIRGVYKADIKFKKADFEKWIQAISDNLYNNVFTMTCYTLNQKFGFGKERLIRFKKTYDEMTKACLDLNYMGEHYVTMEDYAVELNQKFGFDINTALVASSQDFHDEDNENFKNTKYLKGIINSLALAGYAEAADYLRGKLDDSN